MSATRRESMTLVFFLTLLAVGPSAVALTRLALRMRFDVISIVMLVVGGIFTVVTILTLGLED